MYFRNFNVEKKERASRDLGLQEKGEYIYRQVVQRGVYTPINSSGKPMTVFYSHGI